MHAREAIQSKYDNLLEPEWLLHCEPKGAKPTAANSFRMVSRKLGLGGGLKANRLHCEPKGAQPTAANSFRMVSRKNGLGRGLLANGLH